MSVFSTLSYFSLEDRPEFLLEGAMAVHTVPLVVHHVSVSKE